MNNFFAYATTNSWDEDVFQLTIPGIITVVAVIALLIIIALVLRAKSTPSKKLSTKQLVFSAAAMALGIVTSMIKFLDLPMGGSITLFSMLFITLIGYWYGPKVGIMTAVAYGLLQFVLSPVFYTVPQMLIDYPLAFGALGLSGLFYSKKHGLLFGYIAGVLGRFVFAFISGMVFFGSYAPEGMGAAAYSAIYNGAYIFTEAIITLIIIALPPVDRALKEVKKSAIQD